MFVGYPEDHTEGTYLMMNLKTRRVVIGRTVDWLNESYGKNQKLKDDEICRVPPPKEEKEKMVMNILFWTLEELMWNSIMENLK